MKKSLILVVILVASIITTSVIAEELGSQVRPPKIKTLGVLGKGLAILPTDYKVFKIIKIGVAKVVIPVAEEELTVGVLWLDNIKYKLKNIVIGNGTASGDIYLNDTKVGSFEVSSVIKDDTEIWVGTLTVNEETWNVYIIGVPRPMRNIEIGEYASDECGKDPEKCKNFMKGIGPAYCEKTPEDPSCREKIKNWCEEHQNDERCLALLRNYCKKNMDDTRCREVFKEFCKNNPGEEKCRLFELVTTEAYCARHPLDSKCVQLEKKRITEYCLDHPTDQKCVAVRNMNEFRERVRQARYCASNPTSEECTDFCEKHPIACTTPPAANITGA